MRTAFSWIACLLVGLSTAAMHGEEVSVTVTPSFMSQYMFRGVRLGGSSFQPAAELTIEDFTAGLWASFPVSDRVPGQSDPEFDPYISYTFELCENLSLEPGFIAYIYPNADTANGLYRATYEPYLSLDYTVGKLTLTPKVYYDLIMEGPTFELNTMYAVLFNKLHTELDLSASVGMYFWDDSVKDESPRIRNSGSYYQIGVSLPFEIGEHLTITPGVAYAEGFDNYYKSSGAPREKNTSAVGRVVASFSVTWTF